MIASSDVFPVIDHPAVPPLQLYRGQVLGRILVVLLAAAAVVIAAVLYVRDGSFVLERLASGDPTIHSDFDTFWRSAVALLEGGDVYGTGAGYANLNPPIFTVLIAPLGWLDFMEAYRLWVLVTVLVLVASMSAVAAELRMRGAIVIPVIVAVLLSSPVLATLGLGQVYALLAAGLVAAWVAQRRGQLVWAGLALGLVVALKPSLAPVLLVSALRREWPTCSTALLTGTAATIVGWVICGAESMPKWVRLLASNPVVTYWDNASLPGTLLRLTSTSSWGKPLVEVPGGAVIGLVLGGVLLVLTAWVVRRPPVGREDTALWAMAAAALLVSPLSWHNYLVVLIPGVLVLVAGGRWLVAMLLLSLSLIGMEWPPSWYGDDGTVSAVPVSLYCVVLLAYWVAMLLPGRPRGRGEAPMTHAEDEALILRAEYEALVADRAAIIAHHDRLGHDLRMQLSEALCVAQEAREEAAAARAQVRDGVPPVTPATRS